MSNQGDNKEVLIENIKTWIQLKTKYQYYQKN